MDNIAVENGTVFHSSAPATENNCNLTTLGAGINAGVPADIKDNVKNLPHIPYILNGELYEIQTQDGENVTVRCVHCPPDRVYRGSVRSTGNFHMHIKRRHPDLLGKLHDMKVNALIERRDRLMRNRKVTTPTITYRGCRGSSSISNRFHQDPPTPQAQCDTMHKLKIKSAYQRHQIQHLQQQKQLQELQQQNQQETNRRWSLSPSPPEAYEPINYSVKSDKPMVLNNDCLMSSITREEEEEKHLRHLLSVQLPLQTQQTSSSSLLTFANIQSPTECFPLNGNSLHFDRGSDVTPSPSTLSSYSSLISVDNPLYKHQNISVIKDELLMPIEKAIDLTVNGSSLSVSSGLGTNAATSTAGASFETHCAAGSLSSLPILQCNDLLQLALRDIQREMRTRNQIETNRLFLDIAKFKYIHPGFNFQC